MERKRSTDYTFDVIRSVKSLGSGQKGVGPNGAGTA